jgi:hypothetical protein
MEESWRDIIAWKADVEPRFTRLRATAVMRDVIIAFTGTWRVGWTWWLFVSNNIQDSV